MIWTSWVRTPVGSNLVCIVHCCLSRTWSNHIENQRKKSKFEMRLLVHTVRQYEVYWRRSYCTKGHVNMKTSIISEKGTHLLIMPWSLRSFLLLHLSSFQAYMEQRRSSIYGAKKIQKIQRRWRLFRKCYFYSLLYFVLYFRHFFMFIYRLHLCFLYIAKHLGHLRCDAIYICDHYHKDCRS